MASSETTALGNVGNAIMAELIASMHRYGRVASGRTINAIELHIEGDNRMYITGPAYIFALEKGRKATSSFGPFPRYGGLTFKESLKLWMAAKGIEPKAFYPIYRSINKKGFPGTPGVLSKPLSEQAIDKALNENLGVLANLYVQNIANELFK